ncbi:MAG: sigma-70 family RNA polymerase sigma factor [Labilithrix sp.]|nr:sigma-70 family RNA polymerase sigma factor [Labilithrix sp.]
MPELSPSLLREALAGNRGAIRAFVDAMSPVVEARVVRALFRRKRLAEGRDVRQEIEDFTQDVFAALFAHDGRVLRAWDPARGLSLANYVGLVAERQVASILRSGRRSPWKDTPEALDDLDAPDEAPGVVTRIESREDLEALLERLRESLSERGLVLFHRLYVEGEPIERVAESLGMTRDAVYMWRSRVNKLLRGFALERDASPRKPDVGPHVGVGTKRQPE